MQQNVIIETICKLLNEQGKTQKNLTDYLGITQNAFTDWKSGRIKSYNKHLSKIAEYLNVSVDYLLGKEDKKENSIQENGTISIRSRDGSVIESELSDEQLELFKNMLKQFKGNR